MSKPVRIGIVVGETSGDILGAGLISALRQHFPDAIFEGVGGPKMQDQGFHSLFQMERLAVMGLVEPLKRLPELLGIRKQLKQHFTQHRPEIFIGIDAPDFTLNLETALKASGIKTVHYVSPSVWAWRKGRVHKVAKAADLLLTLFPFEKACYEETTLEVCCVGHTLADQIPMEDSRAEAVDRLKLEADRHYIALLPGSRKSEVNQLVDVLLQTAAQIDCAHPEHHYRFLIPAANDAREADIRHALKAYPDLNVTLLNGHSHDVMAASDLVIMASGTTTLEALLLKRPMVIVYKMAALSFYIFSKLVVAKHVGLPNLLAGRRLVPELLQAQATPENICREASRFIKSPNLCESLQDEYRKIHLALRKDASKSAAAAIVKLMNKG